MAQETSEDQVNECEPSSASSTLNTRGFLGRVNTAIYTYNNVKRVVTTIRIAKETRKTRNAYSVAIDSTDHFFYVAQKWLLSQVDPKDQRAIRLMSYDYDDSGEKLYRIFDSTVDGQKVKINGHEVLVKLERPLERKELLKSELIGGSSISNFSTRSNLDNPRLVFWTYSAEANEEVLSFFEQLKAENGEKPKPRLHLLGSYWGAGSHELQARSLESLVLHTGQVERIVADLEQFLRSEKEYARKGIPWHRNYIFYGPPGTGKSSLAKVLASHFGLDLYYYPIGASNSDMEITTQISKVQPRSILLLEDIDAFKGFKKRKADDSSSTTNEFTISGLLNMLDGVMTPHGMITIMTTNLRGTLDEAVTRAGRVDLDEEIGLLEPGQVDRLFRAFYEVEPTRPLDVEGIAPAVVMEIMKRNMRDPKIAESLIRDLRDQEVQYVRPQLILPKAEEGDSECEVASVSH